MRKLRVRREWAALLIQCKPHSGAQSVTLEGNCSLFSFPPLLASLSPDQPDWLAGPCRCHRGLRMVCVLCTWQRQRPGLLVASQLGKTDAKEVNKTQSTISSIEEIPHFFAFLIQFHFLLSTAPMKGAELSHSWYFLYFQSCVQAVCLTSCQGISKVGAH